MIRGKAWRYVVDVPGDVEIKSDATDEAREALARESLPLPLATTAEPMPAPASAPESAPPTSPARRVFEEVGPVTDGFVIRDKDDALYRATRL